MKVMLVCLWFRGQLSFTCESFSSTLLVVLGSRNVYVNCRYLQEFSGELPICSITKILVSCCNSISCSNVGVDMKFKAHEYDCKHFTVKYYDLYYNYIMKLICLSYFLCDMCSQLDVFRFELPNFMANSRHFIDPWYRCISMSSWSNPQWKSNNCTEVTRISPKNLHRMYHFLSSVKVGSCATLF